MNKHIQINPTRLKHQQRLFAMSNSDVLAYLNIGRGTKLSEGAFSGHKIIKAHLQKIDMLFLKGLRYYKNPVNPSSGKNASILLRKRYFHSKLNLIDRQQICRIEETIHYINGVMNQSNFGKLSRHSEFSGVSVADSPSVVAKMVRGHIKNDFDIQSDKDYLKSLIAGLAKFNIIVYEFVEHPSRKLKINVEGAFIAPHWIAIRRIQKDFKREIFTLCHELGHYLLNKEDIDDNPSENIGAQQISKSERWCNDFAFHFLYDGDWGELVRMFRRDEGVLNAEITEVSNRFHLSPLAIYIQLYYHKEINKTKFKRLCKGLCEEYRPIEGVLFPGFEPARATTPSINERGLTNAKPIRSPIIKDAFRNAYFEGVVDEPALMRHLGITNSEKMDEFLYGESL